MQFKLPLLTIILATVLIFTISAFQNNFAFGQFLKDSNTNENGTNSESGNFTSTESGDSNPTDIVVLSQNLKKEESGYRDLVGQVKNTGAGTASSIVVRLSVYGKDGGVVGSDYTDADRDTLPPGQKSTFSFSTESQNFEGMDHYELSLEWVNPDSSQGYKEMAVTYKQNESGSKEDSSGSKEDSSGSKEDSSGSKEDSSGSKEDSN